MSKPQSVVEKTIKDSAVNGTKLSDDLILKNPEAVTAVPFGMFCTSNIITNVCLNFVLHFGKIVCIFSCISKGTPCSKEPCKYEGVCKVEGDGYNCECKTFRHGKNCEEGNSLVFHSYSGSHPFANHKK